MWETRTRKLRKRHTPFAYKRSAADALDRTCEHFTRSAIVLSYGSNAAISVDELEARVTTAVLAGPSGMAFFCDPARAVLVRQP